MNADETYNGHANRETWAFNLHWQNDQGLYLETLEQARTYLVETYGDDWAELPADELKGAFYGVGEHVVNYWREFISGYADEMGTPLPDGLAMFRDEVGSWWRIDVRGVGESVRESLDIES